MSSALFRAAKNGDGLSIQRISLLCRRDAAMSARLIPILLPHIRKSVPYIPSSSTEATAIISGILDPSHPALASILALADLLEHGRSVPQILVEWTSLNAWLVLIFEQVIHPNLHEKAHRILAVISRMLAQAYDFTTDKPIPGCLALMIRIWIHCAECNLSMEAPQVSLLYPVICKLHVGVNGDEIIDALSPNCLDILLDDLRKPHPVEALHPIVPLLTIIMGIAERKQPLPKEWQSLRDGFQTRRSIPYLVLVLRRIIPGTEPMGKSQCIQIFTRYLGHCMVHEDGPLGVAQAIDSGFLGDMAQTFPLFLTGNHRDWQHCIDEYLMFLSSMRVLHPHPIVFRAVRRWLKSPDPLLLCTPDNPMFPGWNSFHEYFQHVLEGRREYKLLPRRLCSNTSCAASTQVKLMKPCAGCLSAHYCSRECQKVDWRTKHRQQCQPPPSLYSLKGAPPIIKDYVIWWFIKISTLSLRNSQREQEICAARGRYPIVFKSTTDEAKIISGLEFLQRTATMDSDEVAKGMLRSGGGEVLLYLVVPDTGRVFFPIYAWISL